MPTNTNDEIIESHENENNIIDMSTNDISFDFDANDIKLNMNHNKEARTKELMESLAFNENPSLKIDL